jgi:dihydroorotate dehydrogenase electron transfer subunit
MKQLNAKVSENENIGRAFYRMRLESPYLAKTIAPGQFVEIRCSDKYPPLLRRPFSVHRILKNSIEILYEVVGEGTKLLSRKKKGASLDIIGPLGNGFNLKRTTNGERQTTILIAGGIGVAPLVALAEELVLSSQFSVLSKKRLCVIVGAKTKSRILCEKDFRKSGAKVLIATENGSKGRKGLATDLLKDFLLTTHDSRLTTIYACGPAGMLKAVAGIAKARHIPCQVSLEERMACGVGVCLGCPVKVRPDITSYGYKMVCKDGPVFDAGEVAW